MNEQLASRLMCTASVAIINIQICSSVLCVSGLEKINYILLLMWVLSVSKVQITITYHKHSAAIDPENNYHTKGWDSTVVFRTEYKYQITHG